MLKILIADDHPIAIEGLKHILSDAYKKIIVHDADNNDDLLRKIEDHYYDLVFLELDFLGYAGLFTIEKIRKKKEGLPIIILTGLPEELFAVRALRNGASGYISKCSSSEELLIAIERVLAGKKYVSSELAEKIANNISENREILSQEKLSNREYQVMQMIASGKEIKKIAYELSINPRTVSTYRRRILKKMALKNNAALTIYAIKNRLIKDLKNSI